MVLLSMIPYDPKAWDTEETPVWLQRPGTWESQWWKFQSEFKSEGRRGLIAQLKDHQAKKVNSPLFHLPFSSGLQWIGWCPSILGSRKRTSYFTLSTNSNVNLIQKHPYKHTQNNADPNIWMPVGPVNLIHEINFTARLGWIFTICNIKHF